MSYRLRGVFPKNCLREEKKFERKFFATINFPPGKNSSVLANLEIDMSFAAADGYSEYTVKCIYNSKYKAAYPS
jgi:hypothetical protein